MAKTHITPTREANEYATTGAATPPIPVLVGKQKPKKSIGFASDLKVPLPLLVVCDCVLINVLYLTTIVIAPAVLPNSTIFLPVSFSPKGPHHIVYTPFCLLTAVGYFLAAGLSRQSKRIRLHRLVWDMLLCALIQGPLYVTARTPFLGTFFIGAITNIIPGAIGLLLSFLAFPSRKASDQPIVPGIVRSRFE